MRISVIVIALLHVCACSAFLFASGRAKARHVNAAPSEIKNIKLPDSDSKYWWDLAGVAFSLLPLAPGMRRKTLQTEIVKGKVWTLDQIQGIINVNVPVRSTIIKLKRGGLFVYNPVAPTLECRDMVRALEQEHGPVKHIVLGSLGLEHKALAGPFSRYFPDADVWLQPGQWSFPINLPNTFLGFPVGSRLKVIPSSDTINPWSDDFDYAVLGPLKFKSVGGFGETAFFHRDTQTLLVTDAVVKVADNPAPILEEDPRALLFHSRDKMLDPVEDTKEARLRGWRRMALFGLIFFPANIRVNGVFETLRQAPGLTPEVNLLGKDSIPISGGLYAWSWEQSEEESFKALQGGLLVAPILSKLILNREPERVLDWVERICKWRFRRIIPCHLENDIRSGPADFKTAFNFLINQDSSSSRTSKSTAGRTAAAGATEADLSLLNQVSDLFTKLGIVAPARVYTVPE